MKHIFRFLTLGLVALFMVVLTNCASSNDSGDTGTTVAASNGDYGEQVQAGIDYFKAQAEEQLPLVEKLLEALQGGDLEVAKTAYVDSRPPYEQIEVLALNFEEEDTDIDARPYAFDNGEEDEAFKGFHRIEAFIFRDEDLEAAVPYGEGLVESVKALMEKLDDPSNFSATDHFAGMIGLATEVPAKKISSEEETWSDQSILIFENNWIGIYSQYEPFAKSLEEKDADLASKVQATYEACMETIKPFLIEGQAGAKPYSSLDEKQRGSIVQASYEFRNALVEAREALGIEGG